MATYSSSDYTNKIPTQGHGPARNEKVFYFSVTCTSAPSTADTINFGYVPANFRLVRAVLKASDMDTNVSPTITLNVGDSGSAARIFSASTVGQAGTVDATPAAGAVFYKYTAKTLITGVAQANAATGAAGTVELALIGYIEDSSTSQSGL
jgi:hypothetical protein